MQIEDIDILVVEDEDELREYLVEYLQLFFKNIYAALSGDEAYKIYLDKRPDIILSDINMPNLDGLSMIARIREQDTETKIIIMSAHSDREKLLHAVELNLVTYLVKPIKTQHLKEVLLGLVQSIKSKSNKLYLNVDTYWDINANILYSGAAQIPLKEKESLLIQLLCSKINHAFSNQDIFDALYANSQKKYSEYAITSLVKRLRAKMPAEIIQNEYGVGYKIAL